MKKKITTIILIISIFPLLIYLFAFVGFFEDKCGCGYRFYIVPRQFYSSCFENCFEGLPMTGFQVTVNRLLLKPINTMYVRYGPDLKPMDFKGGDKLKGEIASAMLWYENEGEAAAISYAKQHNLITEDNKIKLTLMTRGNSSLVFEKELTEYGIKRNQLSNLNNVVGLETDFETIKKLAGEEYINLIMPFSDIVTQ